MSQNTQQVIPQPIPSPISLSDSTSSPAIVLPTVRPAASSTAPSSLQSQSLLVSSSDLTFESFPSARPSPKLLTSFFQQEPLILSKEDLGLASKAANATQPKAWQGQPSRLREPAPSQAPSAATEVSSWLTIGLTVGGALFGVFQVIRKDYPQYLWERYVRKPDWIVTKRASDQNSDMFRVEDKLGNGDVELRINQIFEATLSTVDTAKISGVDLPTKPPSLVQRAIDNINHFCQRLYVYVALRGAKAPIELKGNRSDETPNVFLYGAPDSGKSLIVDGIASLVHANLITVEGHVLSNKSWVSSASAHRLLKEVDRVRQADPGRIVVVHLRQLQHLLDKSRNEGSVNFFQALVNAMVSPSGNLRENVIVVGTLESAPDGKKLDIPINLESCFGSNIVNVQGPRNSDERSRLIRAMIGDQLKLRKETYPKEQEVELRTTVSEIARVFDEIKSVRVVGELVRLAFGRRSEKESLPQALVQVGMDLQYGRAQSRALDVDNLDTEAAGALGMAIVALTIDGPVLGVSAKTRKERLSCVAREELKPQGGTAVVTLLKEALAIAGRSIGQTEEFSGNSFGTRETIIKDELRIKELAQRILEILTVRQKFQAASEPTKLPSVDETEEKIISTVRTILQAAKTNNGFDKLLVRLSPDVSRSAGDRTQAQGEELIGSALRTAVSEDLGEHFITDSKAHFATLLEDFGLKRNPD